MVKMNAVDVQVLQVRSFISPIPSHDVSSRDVSHHGSLGLDPLRTRRTFLTDLLAENARYVLCKHATTFSSATAYATIHPSPTSFRCTATFLAISYAHITDAYTPSL